MSVYRYEVIDDYTLEELKMRYQQSDPKGRIKVIEEIYDNNLWLPFEIAKMAVEDSNLEVRQWFARNAKVLDYRIDEDKIPEKDLTPQVEQDNDPFVRACLRENQRVFGLSKYFYEGWKELFDQTNHLERLALVRNPNVNHKLIEKLFDLEDKELGIDFEQRKDLAMAYLTNPMAQEESRREFFDSRHGDVFVAVETTEHYKKLYELILRWPKYKIQPDLFFRAIQTDDETKAKFYQDCDDKFLRESVLQYCKSDDRKTIELGMKDPEEWCRRIAYSKVRYLNKEVLKTIIEGGDKNILFGLGENENLPLEDLKKIEEKLVELHEELGLRSVRETIERVSERSISQDPEKLFGPEAHDDAYLKDKVDFIGDKLLKMERNMKNIWIALLIGFAIILIRIFR